MHPTLNTSIREYWGTLLEGKRDKGGGRDLGVHPVSYYVAGTHSDMYQKNII
jgi:hypothetical protein